MKPDKCIKCGKTLVKRFGRYGEYYACSGLGCKYTWSQRVDDFWLEVNKRMAEKYKYDVYRYYVKAHTERDSADDYNHTSAKAEFYDCFDPSDFY